MQAVASIDGAVPKDANALVNVPMEGGNLPETFPKQLVSSRSMRSLQPALLHLRVRPSSV